MVHTWEEAIDYLGRLRAANAGLPDPDPGVPDRRRIQRRHHRQSRPGCACCRCSRSTTPGSIRTCRGSWLTNRNGIPDSPYWTQIGYREARLDEDTRRKMIDHSNILFERLGCRDYARFDFRADAEGRDQAARGQPEPRLVLGRQAQPDGRNGRASLLRPLAADHRSGAGARGAAAPNPAPALDRVVAGQR